MKIKWSSEDMGKRNDKARDKDVDKGNKKSVSEAIRSMSDSPCDAAMFREFLHSLRQVL